MLTGVLKEYKAKHADEAIDLVVLNSACAAIWRGNPLVRSIQIYPYPQPHFWNPVEFRLKSARRARRYADRLVREKSYDRVLFPTIQTLPELLYHVTGTYGPHKVPRIARDLGLEPKLYPYDLYSSAEERGRAAAFRAKIGDGPFAIIHPFAGHAVKQMSSGSMRETLDLVRKKGLMAVVVGSEQERARMDSTWETQTAFGWSFGELVELLKLASMFVGTDSAVAHLAGFANTPKIVVFSPKLKPERYAPVSEGSKVEFIYTARGSETESIARLRSLIS
jgi:hypothetical protein